MQFPAKLELKELLRRKTCLQCSVYRINQSSLFSENIEVESNPVCIDLRQLLT